MVYLFHNIAKLKLLIFNSVLLSTDICVEVKTGVPVPSKITVKCTAYVWLMLWLLTVYLQNIQLSLDE